VLEEKGPSITPSPPTQPTQHTMDETPASTTPEKKRIQRTHWCFTVFQLDDFTMPNPLGQVRYCVFQKEKCPKTGRLHYQGYVEFKRSVDYVFVKSTFKSKSLHAEPRLKSRQAARDYCMKEESRIEPPQEFGKWTLKPGKRVDLDEARSLILGKRKVGECYDDAELDHITTKYPRWIEKIHSRKELDYTVDIQLYPWQEEVLEILKGPVKHRRVIWIWSAQSNTGKSTFRDYCALQMDVLPTAGKLLDILAAYDNNDVIWFDFTRAEVGYESYKALETLSNIGIQLSTKFHPVKKLIKSHVVVTANHAPNEAKLQDRLVIYNVDPPMDLDPYPAAQNQEDDSELNVL